MTYDTANRPDGSNADEWAMFISEYPKSPAFLAVQVAEAIDEAVKRTLDATVTAVVHTIGGTVEGHPTSSINYLQRLRELVAFENDNPGTLQHWRQGKQFKYRSGTD